MDSVISRGLLTEAGAPVISAWCPVTNLLAVAGTGKKQVGKQSVREDMQRENKEESSHWIATVHLVDPSCPDERSELEMPAAGPHDQIVSLDWSPTWSRRALLVCLRHGGAFVWTQTPNDESGQDTYIVRAVNSWYSSRLTPSSLKPAHSNNAGHALCTPILSGCWLSPLPERKWSKVEGGLPEAMPFDRTFHCDSYICARNVGATDLQVSTSTTTAAEHHWVRPSMLAAAVVTKTGQLQLWWSCMGRSSTQLQWSSSAAVQLCTEELCCASVCTAPGSKLHCAFIKDESPQCIHIVQVLGCPVVQHLPQLQVSISPMAVLPLPEPDHQVSAATLLRSAAGTSLLVCTAREDSLTGASTVGLLLYGQDADQDADGPVFKPSWQLRQRMEDGFEAGMHMALGENGTSHLSTAMHPTMAVSHDGSRVAVVHRTKVLVLDGETLSLVVAIPLDERTSTAAAQAAFQASHEQPADAGSADSEASHVPVAVACFSPNSCCLCLAEAQPSSSADTTHLHHAPQLDGSAASQDLFSICLAVHMVPDVAVLSSASANEVVNRVACVDAWRLAWSAVNGHAHWDAVSRAVSSGRVTGWYSMQHTCALLDSMVHTQDYPLRPGYCALMDRVKLALLRQVPGRLPALLTCDLMARHIVNWVFQLLQTCIITETGPDGNKQMRIAPEDLNMLQPWIAWSCDYFLLLLSCMKRWIAARAQDPTDEADVLPCIRLLLDSTCLRRLLSVMQQCVFVRPRPGASGANGDADYDPLGDGAAVQQAHRKMFKDAMNQMLQHITQHDIKAKEHQQQEADKNYGLIAHRLYRGAYHLHYCRGTSLTNLQPVSTILAAPGLQGIPDLTHEQICRRAQELGIMYHSPEQHRGAAVAAASQVVTAWRSWRGAPMSAALHSHVLPAGTASSPGSRQKRNRWTALRAAMLNPGGAAAASGSHAASAAAREGLPVLDVVGGRRLPAEAGGWTYESVEGAFVTVELPNSEDAAGTGAGTVGVPARVPQGHGLPRHRSAQHSGTAQHVMRRAWLTACPGTGSMWKRVKLSTPDDLS